MCSWPHDGIIHLMKVPEGVTNVSVDVWDNADYGIAIEALSSAFPGSGVSNEAVTALLGEDPRFAGKTLDPNHPLKAAGIVRRYWLGPEEPSILPYVEEAGSLALLEAGIDPSAVDFYEHTTSSPERLSPPNASGLAEKMGIGALASDRSGACAAAGISMFAAMRYIISNAHSKKKDGAMALITAGEQLSNHLGIKEKKMSSKTTNIFADGAGAMALRGGTDNPGTLAYCSFNDHRGKDAVILEPGGTIQMPNPGAVYTEAVEDMTFAIQTTLEEAEVGIDDVVLVPHGANQHIVNEVGAKVGAEEDGVVSHIDILGNISCVSVFAAADIESRSPNCKLRVGKYVLFVYLGVGWNCLAILMPWKDLNRQPAINPHQAVLL